MCINDPLMINGDTEKCAITQKTIYYAYDTGAEQIVRKLEAVAYSSAIRFDSN